jgi:hypothetical protein
MPGLRSPRPATLLAMMSVSRFPRAASQSPMKRSVAPWVSGRGGTGYISAASMKLTPRPTA